MKSRLESPVCDHPSGLIRPVNAKTSVVIVEDNPGLRNELVRILKSAPDIEFLYTAASGEEALQKIPLHPPSVVLMDIQLPGISGIECVAALKQRCPAVEIVMLTIYDDAENIFRALKAGACGFLIKSSPPERLFQAIREVHSGGSSFSAHIARKVVQYFQTMGQVVRENEKLSPRECEVLELLASGYIYKEIADQLGIGVETVRSHVKNICVKMHVRNRTEAVARHRM